MFMKHLRSHYRHRIAPTAGVTLVAAKNIRLHGRGQREGGFGPEIGLAPPHHGIRKATVTIFKIVYYDSRNRIVRYSKSYRTISRIVQYDIQQLQLIFNDNKTKPQYETRQTIRAPHVPETRTGLALLSAPQATCRHQPSAALDQPVQPTA